MTLVALILVIVLSALIIKVGSVALRMTGMDKEAADFQSLSAFTGTGFTTAESENMVNHPQRRRIIKRLMVLGNVGIVSAVVMLIFSFSGGTIGESLTKIGILGIVAATIGIVFLGKGIENVLDGFIEKRLSKITQLSIVSFHEVMRLASGYGIVETLVTSDHELAGKRLIEAKLSSSNVLILAIKRGFHIIATPRADERIEPGDRLVCFGPMESIIQRTGERRAEPEAEQTPS